MLMCVESVYVVGACSVVAIEHGRYSLSDCEQCWGSVWYVGSFKLCCEILLLNVVESDMCGECVCCGWLQCSCY